MIGLDTNVIVAWMAQKRRGVILKPDTYRISHVALMEYEWVLSRKLKLPKERVVEALRVLLTSSNIRVDKPEVVKAAFEDFTKGGSELTDFMIMRDNEAAGCRTTLTLDHKASNKPGFTYLRN